MSTDQQSLLAAVPPLRWGESGECTFAGALSAATQATEAPFDYTFLMGVTGLAFRTRWFQGPEHEWCPSSPVGEFPEEIDAAKKATGWQLRVANAPLEPYAREMAAMLQRGRPFLAYGSSLNVGVAVGIEPDGQTLLVQDDMTAGGPLKKAIKDLEMFVLFLDEHCETLPTEEAVRAGLQIAVRNWSRDHDPAGNLTRGYWFGQEALAHWTNDLEIADAVEADKKQNLFFVSWWCFSCLVDARGAAGRFLQAHSPGFSGAQRRAMERAAAHYQEEWAMLASVFETRGAFLGPWSGKSIVDWTPGVRRREVAILGQAREIEDKAINELAEAFELRT